MATIGQTLRAARARIEAVDAELLLAHAAGLSRGSLYARGDDPLDPHVARAFDALVARRAAGEPVAYLVGSRGFWSLDLRVTPDTLVPRPETERLVELALERIPPGAAIDVLDLGTGSGAIALAIARERPRARILATDASAAALEVAAGNARRLGIDNVRFARGDWWTAAGDARFDVVASNPPYIADDDPHLAQGDLPREPRSALASGRDGLDAIRAIVAGAPARLRPGGWLLLEHGFDQGGAVRGLLRASGFAAVATATDLEGRDRVSSGCLPGPVRASSDRP
jgi:release factor glutamine methyltransferase